MESAVFKCINYRCRNVSFKEGWLCRFCQFEPFGFTKEELKKYGDLPFHEMLRISAEEEAKRQKEYAERTKKAAFEHAMRRPQIVIPSHFNQ